MRKTIWNVPEELSKKPKDSNLIFCPQCYRTKLQFRTLKEAEDYMKWNSPEISRENGKYPVRAYWCSCCCCYHVTSKLVSKSVEHRKSSIMALLEKAKEPGKDHQESKGYLRKSYEILTGLPPEVPWINEVAQQILDVSRDLERSRFDEVIKETEYLLRIGNWSGSEVNLQWLEANNFNPEKVEKLRAKLMTSM